MTNERRSEDEQPPSADGPADASGATQAAREKTVRRRLGLLVGALLLVTAGVAFIATGVGARSAASAGAGASRLAEDLDATLTWRGAETAARVAAEHA